MSRLQHLQEELAAPLPHPGREELARFQKEVANWGLEHFLSMGEQAPGHGASRAEMEALLREPAPEEGAIFAHVLEEYCEKIVPNTFRVQHPRFLAFVPCAPSFVSILGDWLSTSLNCYSSVWFEGSGAAQVELLVVDWFKEWLEFPKEAAGTLTGGGSEANMTALVVARERLSYAERSRAVLYQSDQRHWSVDKAVKVIGFRPDQIRLIPTDEQFRLSVSALSDAIVEDRQQGRVPWAIVANAGTTNTGAIDPLDALVDLCRRENIWLHVDAAYGGAAVLSPLGREKLRGLECVHSITLDPHKWFAQTFEAGLVLIRDGKQLPETFAMLPEYLRDVAPTDAEINLADYSLTLTRRFRALKIWLSVKTLGLNWFRRLIDHSLKLTELTELLLLDRGKFEMLSPRELSVVCFRYRPPGWPQSTSHEEKLNALNRAILTELYKTGRAFMTSTELRGRTALRCCFVNWRTTAADVAEVVGLLTEIGDRLANEFE